MQGIVSSGSSEISVGGLSRRSRCLRSRPDCRRLPPFALPCREITCHSRGRQSALSAACSIGHASGRQMPLYATICEAKSVEPCDLQRFRMQLLSSMKLLDKPLGLVMNFGEERFGSRGIRRVILKGADNGYDPFEPSSALAADDSDCRPA